MGRKTKADYNKYQIQQNMNYKGKGREYYIDLIKEYFDFNSNKLISYKAKDIKDITGIKDFKAINSILVDFIGIQWGIHKGTIYYNLPPVKK